MIKVNDVYPSIQGEGRLTGVPMILLRLHGCSVGCPWCDTKETWGGTVEVSTLAEALGQNERYCNIDETDLAVWIASNTPPAIEWVLVTGGEPAEQNLAPLVDALHGCGFMVALETSGTADGHMMANFDHVCVSPKIGMPGGKAIIPDVLRAAGEIKQVIGKQSDIDSLVKLLDECEIHDGSITISVQPLSESKKATEICVKACLEWGWNLSIQTHKLIAVR